MGLQAVRWPGGCSCRIDTLIQMPARRQCAPIRGRQGPRRLALCRPFGAPLHHEQDFTGSIPSRANGVVRKVKLVHVYGMIRMTATILRQMLLLVVLTVALAATGFAHRVPALDDVALQAYVLAGGDLCGDADGDGLPDHGKCPACQIVGSADLRPVSASIRDADLILVATILAQRESRAIRVVLDPAHGMRAPPLV